MVIVETISASSSDVVSNLQPLFETISPLVARLTLLLGGLAGVYAILLIARVHYERKKVKIMEQIRYDLDHLNMYYGIPHSRQKRGIFHRLIDWLFPGHRQSHIADVDVTKFYQSRKKRR